ncbi:MAG: hypothetical protein J5612_04760 [Paludibacteraceae bacterium]|nr:hypothetical protein [Paludibacteraceae bacterium]
MIINKLYRFILLVAVLCLSESLAAAEKVVASDSRITWVGRAAFDHDGSVSFDWTGVYCRIRLTGDMLRMRVHDSGRDYYNMYIDVPMSGKPTGVIDIEGDIIYNIPLTRGKKIHEVILQKRTEAEQGRTTFFTFETNGRFLQAEPLRPLQIQFIGDSYTCGYGIEALDSLERFTPETENVCKSFASLVAHKLKADYTVIAHSGIGVCRNYNSRFPGWTMPVRYNCWFDMDSTSTYYGNSEWRPMTIIMLGGNDFSCGVTPDYNTFRDAYFDLLSQLDDSMLVICCTKTRNTELSRYVERVVLECDHPNAYFFAADFDAYTNHREYLGADKHPNAKAHRRLAEQLLAYLKQFF